MPISPKARLEQIVALYPPPHDREAIPEWTEDEGKRFLLVEENAQDGSSWFTLHATPDDAAAYHDGQEYPEDWSIGTLVDLVTGAVYEAKPGTTTFEPTPNGPMYSDEEI